MEKKNNRLYIKIIIPVLIVAVIAVIWFVKNADKSPEITTDNPDFTLHATEEFDLEKLKTYGLPIMIDFGAGYCEPCKEMAPVLEKLNKELQGKAIIKYVDVQKYPELAKDYPITYIPTQVFLDKEGKPYTPSDPQASQMNMYSLKDTDEHALTAHVGGMTEEMILEALKEMGLEE
jgi:thioredoxin 1